MSDQNAHVTKALTAARDVAQASLARRKAVADQIDAERAARAQWAAQTATQPETGGYQ